jgi:hypothetical protein
MGICCRVELCHVLSCCAFVVAPCKSLLCSRQQNKAVIIMLDFREQYSSIYNFLHLLAKERRLALARPAAPRMKAFEPFMFAA